MKPRKDKLIYILMSLLLVGFSVTILISFFVSRQSLRAQITENNLPLTSDNIYSEIQRDILRPIFISSLMASDTFVRDWIIIGEKTPNEITRYLGEIKDQYNLFTTFFVSEKTRKYYHAKGTLKTVSEDVKNDAWYFRTRDLNEPYEINVDVDAANSNALTVFVNFRVLDYAQQYIGAIGVGLTVDEVSTLIESYENRYDRLIYFVDESGNVKLSGEKFPKDIKNIFDADGIALTKEQHLSKDIQLVKFKRKGTNIHLATRYIPEFKWYLFVEESEKNMLKSVVFSLFFNLSICGVVIAIVLVITHKTIASYQKKLEQLTITDELTGAHNRRSFDLLIAQTLKEVKRNKESFSLILFDIDHFKLINDTYGHLAGDKVIQHLVQVVKDTVRNSDVICRWGGEEFLIILRQCDEKDALLMAENIRVAIAESTTQYRDQDIKITVSLGASQYRPGEDKDELLRRIDKSLYLAKEKGRNRVEHLT